MGPPAPFATAYFLVAGREPVAPLSPGPLVVNVAARRIRGQIGCENVATFRIELYVNKSFTNLNFVSSWLSATPYAPKAALLRCTMIVNWLIL
jgi:hypothetical protein